MAERGLKRLAIISALVPALWTVPAFAQAPRQTGCVPHAVAVERLHKEYGESVAGLGLGKNGQSVVELYVGDGRTWTILITLVNGLSCIAAAGDNWTESDKPEGGAL
jgi:hypothetical protein